MSKRRTNLREIAQKLGLSASTVSRALRDLPGIHPETRQQILDMAQQMGYQLGEQTTPKRFSNILTLTRGVGHRTDHEYLAGMSSAAIALNLSLISHYYRPEESLNVLKPEHQPRALTAGDVAGIVLIHRWPEEIAKALRARVPVVSVIHDYPGSDVDVVTLDDRGGMDLLVGHLARSGCKRIGFFGLCAQMTWSRSRFAGYADAMIQHGQELRMSDVVDVTLDEALSENEFPSGMATERATKLMGEGVDAWICSSEVIARSLYEHLVSQGVKIPQDVSLTSFHSSKSSERSQTVNFTSVEGPSAELGAAALRRLVHRIEGSDTTRRIILLPCTFHQGKTTHKPR